MKNLIFALAFLIVPALSISVTEAATSHACVVKPGNNCHHVRQHVRHQEPANDKVEAEGKNDPKE
jgi:hypothetical protein